MTHTHTLREKLPAPDPEAVRAARKAAGLSQTEASQLVSDAGAKGYRTWQRYEASKESTDHRAIPGAVWEFFLLLTNQHPLHRLVSRPTASAAPVSSAGVHEATVEERFEAADENEPLAGSLAPEGRRYKKTPW